MKHIIKVETLQNLPETRPLIAMDANGVLFAKGQDLFVDLGLVSGTKWAKYNIGASSISDYGDYFAWGETETKSDYSWETYNYGSDWNKLTKYCPSDKSEYWDGSGNPDNLTQLVPTDDVAAVTNSAWRMPTKEECEELKALPNKWMNVNGVNGRVFVSENQSGVSEGDFGIVDDPGLYFYDVDQEFQMMVSDYFSGDSLKYITSIDELNTVLTDMFAYQEGYEGQADATTMLFKDEEHTILAVAGTDYTFGSFPSFNSNSMLFIPAAGYRSGSDIDDVGSNCGLWSSSLGLDSPDCAYSLHFDSSDIYMSYSGRYNGFSVRPVC